MRIYLVLILFLLTSNLLAQKPSTNIHFTPNTYFRNYSIQNQPVLKIQQGDTVTTESVDAGGVNKHGKKVTERGNPLTGPFYIQNAEPGDIIAIHIISVKLNRSFATTLNTLIPKMQDKKVAMKNWKSAKLVRWYLDTINLIAKPDSQFIKLQNVSLPLHPFLGCVGVASAGEKGMSSGGSDYTGGNLDFNLLPQEQLFTCL